MESTRNKRRTLRGTVVGDKMAKTITVRVERRFKHPKYGKYVSRHKSHHAHDEQGEAQLGDIVEIASTRPLSKTKRWRLVRIVTRAALHDAPEGRAEQGAVEVPDEILGGQQ